MLDKAIEFLMEKHPWMTKSQAFILVFESYERNKPQDKYSGMGKTLTNLDIGIYGRQSKKELQNKLAAISEWY